MSEIETQLAKESENHNPFHQYVNLDGSLSSQGIAQADFAIRMLAHACYTNAERHGWYENVGSSGRNFGEVIALMHSELSEALEAYREGDLPTEISYGPCKSTSPVADNEIPKPEGVASELADVIIRIFDYAGAMNVPLAEAIIQKHAYNMSRPYRHGGKLA